MDVRCTRCQTHYQLDDTLVSERGTTVSCTSCGHRFRVEPANAAVARDFATDDTVELSTTVREAFPDGVAARYGAPQDSLVDLESSPHSQRSVGSRWILALVVLGGLGLLAGTVGRRYLERFAPHEVVEARDPDRLQAMIKKGEQLFFDDDLEGAKAEFDKATVLAENDPVAVSFLARIESVQADMIWLRLRLASDASQILQLRQALVARLAKLDRAVATALRVAKDNPAVLRAQVDSLRLSGKLGEARTLAPKLSSAGDEPETSYVLAALDIADESPSWLGVIERLRPAAASEHGFGRARAALTYALIRAERFADARSELTKVKPDAFQLTLFAAAESYLGDQDREHIVAAAPPAPPVAVPTPSPEVPSPAEPGVVAAVAFEAGKQTRSEAARARAKGDIEGATRLYQQVLERSPNDADALTNLGELAAQRRDFTSAMQYFQKVEDMNPNYLPALNGIADIQWLNGEKGRAVALYQRVLDSAGASSSYGAHAKIRIDEYQRVQTAAAEETPPASGEQGTESPETEPSESPEQSQ